MRQRGRKSVASLSIVTPLPSDRRPPPPEGLTEAQRQVWRSTVEAAPADYFSRESYPVLIDYCRHVVRSRRLDVQIEKHGEDIDATLLEKLYVMAERESRAVLAHARSLRLTLQARVHPVTAHRKLANVRPPSYYE